MHYPFRVKRALALVLFGRCNPLTAGIDGLAENEIRILLIYRVEIIVKPVSRLAGHLHQAQSCPALLADFGILEHGSVDLPYLVRIKIVDLLKVFSEPPDLALFERIACADGVAVGGLAVNNQGGDVLTPGDAVSGYVLEVFEDEHEEPFAAQHAEVRELHLTFQQGQKADGVISCHLSPVGEHQVFI